MTEAELAAEKQLAHERAAASVVTGVGTGGGSVTSPATLVLAWAAVGIPLAIGIGITLQKAAILFK